MDGQKYKVVVGILLVAAHTSFAQLQPKNLIKHWSAKDGLSQGVVNSITQDEQSLIWFATEDGLNRFDGYSFKVFRHDPDNVIGIPDNFIQHVFRDSEGILWVSSRNGLLEFDPFQESFSLYQHDFEDKDDYAFNDVSFISEGNAGNLWIAWYGAGFASFDKNKKTFIPYTPRTLAGLTSGKTVALLEDKSGLLWVGTQDGGVNVFRVGKGEVVQKMENLSRDSNVPSWNVHCFAEDKFGNVWIGTSEGLVVYRRQENRFFSFDDKDSPIHKVNVFSLYADSNDNLWIGSQGGGLYQLDLRQFNTRRPEDFVIVHIRNLQDFDISKRTILCIYEDKDKNIWIGTFGEGAYLVSSVKENFVKIQKPVYDNAAVSFVSYYGICYDQEGNLWLGTDGNGIYKSDPNGHTIDHFTAEHSAGLQDNAILSALCDSKGRIWFGSYSHGVFRYDKRTGSFINYRYKNSGYTNFGGNDVRVIFEDSKNNIWVGTNRGGLCLLDENEKTYSNPQQFTGALVVGDIRAIAEDKQGTLWIGCYGDGLYSYLPVTQKFKRHFNDPEGKEQLRSNIVFAVNCDRSGNIWIGTGGGGIGVFHPEKNTFKRYTEKDGLANNTIYALLIDNSENVWFSTNAGISKFDISDNKFFNYNVSDGLQEGQFNPGSALHNQLSGYMCLGGTLGLNIFFPDRKQDVLKKPEIMISGFSLFNKPVSALDSIDGDPVLKQVISRTQHITLTHDQNVITFEFVGVNYSHPEKNVYAYKLDGLDDDWNFVGNQRSATYRYLEPGTYTFKVKASNVENQWGDDFASVVVEIKPPFWQTPWAYLLYLLGIGGLAFLVISFRKKQLKLSRRLKIEKSQRKHERRLVQQKLTFFTEISHEFKTPLTLMIGPLEEMLSRENGSSDTSRKLKLVYRNAHKLLNLINKLLDYRKIETGNIVLRVTENDAVAFAEDICTTFRELADHKNIKFTCHAEQSPVMAWFDKEKMEMVLSNIISNSFKYIGKGNEVSVHVGKQINDRYPRGRVVIKIRDNGIGIPKKQLGNVFDWFYKGEYSGNMSTGIGLSLARKLVHLHKGEIFVDSVEGSGSTFSIKIPLGNDHFKPEEIVTQVVADNAAPDVHFNFEEAHDDVTHKKGLKSLLLIEDDDEIRGFLKEYFEKDYRIFESPNGKEGLDAAIHHHPDLIISDIMMPEMDGIEFCKAIKGSMRTSHIPVILLTARTSHTHHKEGIETGADAYITKPFSPEILKLTVHNLLQAQENLMRFYRNLFTPGETSTEDRNLNPLDEKFLQTIYEMLKANMDKTDFNINELCHILNMSRSLVYKKVKMLTGLSPVEYVRSLRLKEAARLLKTRQYKVFEVVYMVGFTDLKYFRKCFVKEFGHSPSDFIRQMEES